MNKALEAKYAQEEATLYEKIQLILTDVVAKNIIDNNNQQETKNYISQKFKNDKLEASIETYEEGYIILYGIHTKKVLILNEDFKEINSTVAIVGKTDEWEYKINDDNSATLTVYKKNISGNLNIPNIIDNHLVSALGDDLFNYATKMTSMTLPEGLITIGARTFQGCNNLQWEVQFPSTIKEVGDSAFNGCSKITGNLDEIMKYNVKYGKGVFMRCSSLKGNIETLMGMLDENETVISESLFSGFSSATGTLTIPARITKIENNAFYGCSGISAVVFESNDNLQSIGNNAFYQCNGLTGTLDLPDSVESIGEYAFYKNSGITGLELPNSLSSMGTYAFAECENIGGTVNISASLNKLENCTFIRCQKIDTVVFNTYNNKGTIEIGSSAFYGCGSLQNLTLPDTINTINEWAFYSCHLNKLYLPDSLTTVGKYSFNNCRFLDIIHWSQNLKRIDSNAFVKCEKITTLPNKNGLTYIGDVAFENCFLLGSTGENNIIYWLNSSNISELGSAVFNNCSYLTGDYLGSITNKNNSTIKINGSPFSGTNVKFAKVLNLNEKNVISSNEYAGVTKFLDDAENEITTINIPDNITRIENGAFSGCSSIKEINITNNVTYIGQSAFSNCTSLTNIKLPVNSSYTIMNASILSGCTGLQSIEIPKYITQIGANALANCNLLSLNVPSSVKKIEGGAFGNNYNLASITLNEGLESIGSQFLRGAAITEINIPNSVTDLKTSVLHYCPNLKKITIGKGVTKIPKSMLFMTMNVEEITIKGNITEIGAESFANATYLKKLDMNWKSVMKIDSKAFYNCPSLNGTITLNPSCSISENAFDGCSLNITK